LKPGEVAVYSDEGDSIVFGRDNQITITTEKKLAINVEDGEVAIEAKSATLKCEDGIEIEAPSIKIKGDIELDGNLSATGSINAPQGNVGGP
jgi:phage gp45-like